MGVDEEVKALLEWVQTKCRPLKGIVHAAGGLMDAGIEKQDWVHMETVFAPRCSVPGRCTTGRSS